MDLYSRKVLSWRISLSMDADFCIEALKDAMANYGVPAIFNTDQGSQFTSYGFIKVLKDAGVEISMDGQGRWRDNIYVERFWRTLKYEDIYLKSYESVRGLKAGLSRYFRFYNGRRYHQSLDYRTPDVNVRIIQSGGWTDCSLTAESPTLYSTGNCLTIGLIIIPLLAEGGTALLPKNDPFVIL